MLFIILFIILVLLLLNMGIKDEGFIVADAQDFHNYPKHRAAIMKESNTFDDGIKVPPRTCIFKGYNYPNYINSVEPTEIDVRILSQTARGLPIDQRYPNIPVASNYVFQ